MAPNSVVPRKSTLRVKLAQVDFAGELTLQLANRLIQESDRPVVILIQGDHGPGPGSIGRFPSQVT